MDDEGLDHTVLCKFRLMLIDNGQAKVCFDLFRRARIDTGLTKFGEAVVIDTTHVVADIAILNTCCLPKSAPSDGSIVNL